MAPQQNKLISTPCQVRSKFLMSLGVGTSPTTSKHPLTEVADAVDLCTPTRDLKNVPRHSVQLQYNRHDERKHMERRQKLLAVGNANPNSSSSSSSSPSAFEKSKPKRSITFNESVDVVPIPMRHEYSDRIRSRLWSNTIELYENAGRSCKKLTMHQLFVNSRCI